MTEQTKCSELATQILIEAPASRKALIDNSNNLHKVADYCENNYLGLQDEDTWKGLEETKALTTQALASVAYQINSLATSVLRLLDTQAMQLKDMENSINLLSLAVAIHQEKVSRREMGIFTTVTKLACAKLMSPPKAGRELEGCYIRRPMSFTGLDTLGHSFNLNESQPRKRTGTTESVRSTGSCGPVECPVAPATQPGEPSSASVNKDLYRSNLGINVALPSVPTLPVSSNLIQNCPQPPPGSTFDSNIPPPPPPPPGSMGTGPPPPTPSMTSSNNPPPPTPNASPNVLSPPPPPPPPASASNSFPPPPPPGSMGNAPSPPHLHLLPAHQIASPLHLLLLHLGQWVILLILHLLPAHQIASPLLLLLLHLVQWVMFHLLCHLHFLPAHQIASPLLLLLLLLLHLVQWVMLLLLHHLLLLSLVPPLRCPHLLHHHPHLLRFHNLYCYVSSLSTFCYVGIT
ncbi:ABI gene family member 3-like isoform X2 [Oncorhynchus keta]|uniref:ABI gene family member 3-like isoform X2 n=1 Tax=Oncorhynchus keta TaxID=8018 RepID=UPI00227A14C0|nr:ABI gene family member 3-like isoform X2 [Oncorhynchus keta]